ncbi:AEN-like protein [Mya arenaria]|uniref:AEN-like protein n=1 Tax=Mya arenaria TaxID=6604 RepID=A0ABY7E9J1_MYAAR|nr:AEN-like protein [Mya arenaria]
MFKAWLQMASKQQAVMATLCPKRVTYQTLTAKRLKNLKNVTKLEEGCEIIIDISKKGRCQFKLLQENGHEGKSNQSLGRDLPTVMADTSSGSSGSPYNGQTRSNNNKLNGADDGDSNHTKNTLEGPGFPPLNQYVALDCEFVGVRNDQSALGRCSIVDHEGGVLCDVYVQPEEPITTYRTRWSGITKKHMKNAIPHEFALSKISAGKIVVGHDLFGDFSVLGMRPRREFIRDTSKFPGFGGDGGQKMSLKRLALKYFGDHIQVGSHCSVQDARTAMSLYRLVRHEWETNLLKQGKCVNQSDDSGNQSDQSSQNQSTSGEGNADTPSDKLTSSNRGSVNGSLSNRDSCLGNHFGKLSRPGDELACILTKGKMSLSSDNQVKSASCNNKESNCINVKRSEKDDTVVSLNYWEIDCKEKVGIKKEMEKTVNNGTDQVTEMTRSKRDSCLALKGGKVSKKKRKNKKKNKTHFGQINSGNHSVEEYFKAGSKNSVLKRNSQNICKKNALCESISTSCKDISKHQSEDLHVKKRTLKLNNSEEDEVTYSTTVNHLYNDEFWPQLNQDS